MKKLVIGVALSLACFSLAVNAGDLCANLPGQWSGNGRVVIDVPSVGNHITCVYNGVSKVTSADVNSHTFTSDITLTLLAGICPATEKLTIPGNCEKGNIVMIAEDGTAALKGKLNQNGKIGTISGEVAIELNGHVVQGRLEKTILVKVK